MIPYLDFVAAKAVAAPKLGLSLDTGTVNPLLHRHQPVLVEWLVEGGRRVKLETSLPLLIGAPE